MGLITTHKRPQVATQGGPRVLLTRAWVTNQGNLVTEHLVTLRVSPKVAASKG
jgi:hypothetical protein